MKNAINIGVVIGSILLAGCGAKSGSSDAAGKLPGDAELRQKVVGTWTMDADSKVQVTFKSDGTALEKSEGQQGSWVVTNGMFVLTESNKDGSEPDIETGKIIRLNDHEMVLQEPEATNVMSFHKQ